MSVAAVKLAAAPVSAIDRATEALFNTRMTEAKARKLWEELTDERPALAERLRVALAASIDPAVKSDQARQHRADADALKFELERLDALVASLGKRVAALLGEEAEADRKAAYDDAKRERDELVDIIRTRYPTLVAELVAIAQRLEISNGEVAVANKGRSAADWLYSAEGIARGRAENAMTPSILDCLSLPAPKDHGCLAWPRAQNPIHAREIAAMLPKVGHDRAAK